jgi:uncharacterized protein
VTRRAVLLFAQPASREARLKGLSGAEPLFDLLRRRAVAAVLALPGVDLVVAGDPGGTGTSPGVHLLRQRGRSFAERLTNAFGDTRSLGYGEVVAVGADSPGLSERHLAAAFHALRSREVVLGPAPDGGVYLIGCRGEAGPMLRGVQWRTGRVLGQLRERCPDAVVLAEILADVDDRADLRALLDGPALGPEILRLIRRLLNRLAAVLIGEPGRLSLASLAPADSRGPPLLRATSPQPLS